VPGEDQIAFEGVNASFADLSIVTEGNRAVIRLGETELRLGGLTAEDLSAEDFLFPDATPVVAADPDAIVLPDGATVIDVTEYGVIADDGIDDTSAIQQMVNAVGRGTYYFADGTYDISDTILLPSGQGTNVPSFMTFQGESEDGTIFKLADGLDHQGPIIGSTGSVAQAFNNRFRDMTFDIGTGNTQADGLQFAGNNQSTVKDVTIRSGEGGRIGLDLVSQSELGPALIEDVTVEGFETGIATAFQGNSVTLEDITLRGQDVGISSTDAHVAFLRGIDYEGPGTGVANRFVSHMVLTDSTFTSTDPGIENQSAVTSAWSLYGRNIEAEGFDTTINTAAQGFISNEDTIAEDIEEYIYFGNYERLRGGSFELFEGSAETGLDLEVRETPETVWNVDVGTWVDVRDFGAVEGQDATAAFQAAIDSGATTVYVPDGTWQLDGEVVIRGAVEQVLSSGLARVSEGAQLRIADGTSDQVIIEGLNNEGSLKEWDIVHDSGRTVVLRDIVGFNYEAVSEGDQGDVFLANVVGGQTIFRDQDVWARQLNLEGDSVAKGHEAKVINDGANVWILGLKTEGLGTTVKTVNDGQTELLGSFHNGSVDFDIPRFITEDASFWTTIVDGSTFSQDFELVRETRDGVTREGRMTSDNIRPDVYSAFDPAVIADRVIIVDNDEATATGAWQSATSFPGNFLGGDFLFAAGGSDAAIDYAATAVATGRYDVSIRFIEERGGQPSSGHADAVDVEFGVADDVFTFADLDMKDATERWQDLGVIDVAAGEEMFVRFDAEGVDGNVIADAVRFERIVEETGQDDLLV
ncbi:MAG: glycosyl hydrolase family 28-related protein, partial [Pseudomonadota bacterium]